jgi:hypothetical protein
MIIEGVESELRYLTSKAGNSRVPSAFSSLALPITSSSGSPTGSLYMLMPHLDSSRLELEVRLLTVFSRIIGEMRERQQAAIYSAEVSVNVVSLKVLKQDQFKAALLAWT